MSLEGRRTAHISDPGAELLDRAQSIWERYGRMVAAVVGMVVVVGVLGFFLMRSRAASEQQAAGKLAEANVLFWQGQYDRSLESAKKVAQQYGSTPSGNDAHRLAGDDAYWNGMQRGNPADFKNAVTEYQAYLAHAGRGPLADAARRSLAYALESDKQYEAAAKNYDQLVGAFDRESSAEFLIAAARSYQALGRRDEALKRLQRVIDEFGDTSYALPARVRIAQIQNTKP